MPAHNPRSKKKAQTRSPTNGDKFLVVGVGASAGGIGAVREFFTHVPKDSRMAYVVILHMSPEHESKLAEILQVHSPIPITQVKESEKITPDHVYVIPPNRNLEMVDGHVTPTEMFGSEERRSPVDLFFRTLAETSEDRGVSVVLSGTGADGSIGLKRIKEYGGVAFVQDPTEAEYSDMPRNAIATGMVDYVLPVSEIPRKIISYRDHFGAVQLPETDETPKTDEQALIDIFTQLRMRTGHDFSNYKRATILRRIDRRMGLRELPSLPDYARYMKDQPAEVQAFLKDLLISVTNFFRDAELIEALANKALPKIFENKSPSDPLRVWVAGCATGEEAYSLAMLMTEYATPDGGAPNLQIFATDLDQDAIQIARDGYYKDAEIADISPERLRRFFTREAEGYRVRRELRETILFAAHNVIKDPPFSHLDIVSCRNLLIYLNRIAQSRVLEVLHFALNPTGFLFLGASESIDGASDLFSVVDKEHHVFRARSVAPRPLPIPDVSVKAPMRRAPFEREQTAEEARAIERLSFADLHQRLLEQYAAPSVIVNEDYDVVHLSDRAGRYMQVAGGEPSNNLLRIVRPELRIELRTALYQAVHNRTNVESRGLRVSTDKGVEVVNLHIRPVLREDDTNRGFILVIFEEVAEASAETPQEIPTSAEPIANRLEAELQHLKAQLRATVEQYEIQQEELRASNEELQAMGEELRSAAEELETSKEELQSVNEELTTVNQELKIKIEEFSQANNNFQNLMNSTNIGTIFLSRDLRVRQFTPTARETFNLIPTDIGRPLMDITSKIKCETLGEDIESVLRTLQTIEREVSTADNRFMMRLSPYRTLDDKIDGLVMTLIDVTERARAEEMVRRAGEQLETKVEERTKELATANVALKNEIQERRASEDARLALLRQLVTAQEDERRRLARDLHDQLGQQLTSLRLKIDSMKATGKISSTISDLQAIVKRLDDDVDFLAWELRPVALDELGLEAALSSYAQQWSGHFKIPVNFHGNLGPNRLAPEVESNLYRLAQEALNNCAKHSKCKQADIILERREHHVVLIIEDDGIGFDTSTVDTERRLGLVGMRERAALVSGRFEIESTAGKGTTVLVRVPFQTDEGE